MKDNICVKSIVYKMLILFLLINTLCFSNVIAVGTEEGNGEQETNENNLEKLTVTFFEVGNGDCIFVDCGNIEMIIDSGDSGSKQKFDNIKNFFIEKIEDGILEYAFITHGDSDHIKNMFEYYMEWFNPESKNSLSNSKKNYYIQNLIDFDTEISKKLYVNEDGSYKTTIVENYIKKRNDMLDKTEEKNSTDKGIKNYYSIDKFYSVCNDGKIILGENFVLHVLKNIYNFQETPKNKNVASICLLLEYGETKTLLTGDLETKKKNNYEDSVDSGSDSGNDQDGEAELLNNNDNELLKNVTLFKAAHHGSETANSKKFIDHIKPQYVMISCNAGGQHGFPHQNTEKEGNSPIDNFLTYTSNIYISSYKSNDNATYSSYHGDVTFDLYKEGNVEVSCSNKENSLNLYLEEENGDKKLNLITETTWFKDNRTSSIKTYVFSGYQSSDCAYIGNCTLVKYGSQDILIDCGNCLPNSIIGACADNFIKDIENYCIDGILECVIVTSPMNSSISQLVDIETNGGRKGVLSIFKVEKLVDFGNSFDPSDGKSNSNFNIYISKRNELIANGTKYYSAKACLQSSSIIDDFLEICPNLKINILKNKFYETKGIDRFESNVSCTIDFHGNKLLFTGNIHEKGEKEIVDKNDLSNIVFFLASDYGYIGANSKYLLNKIGNKSKLTIAVNTTLNALIYGRIIMNKALCDLFINNSRSVYVTTEYFNGEYNNVCGTIEYSLFENGYTYINAYKLVPLRHSRYYNSLDDD